MRPAIAYPFDSSLNNATIPRMSATGGADITTIPTRNPRGEPQPKPGTRNAAHVNRIHGVKASRKLILPIQRPFILTNPPHRVAATTLVWPRD